MLILSYTDFEEGTMTMRGLSFEFGGDLPNVTADNSSLRLSFCCREDGPTSTAIHLPDYPFLLFKARFVHIRFLMYYKLFHTHTHNICICSQEHSMFMLIPGHTWNHKILRQKFADNKTLIRSSKSKDRQYYGQQKKDKQ